MEPSYHRVYLGEALCNFIDQISKYEEAIFNIPSGCAVVELALEPCHRGGGLSARAQLHSRFPRIFALRARSEM
jgi:hypothetical protein